MRPYRVVGDWGTSRLRLFRIEGDAVVDRAEGPGIGALDAAPADVLRAVLAPWRIEGEPGSIRLCGMVGSRNGWVDVPYVDCPADLATWAAGAVTMRLDGIPVSIMAGLATLDAHGVPDVMRGEETQIFGAIRNDPALGTEVRTIALPGTHSKWAVIEDGRIMRFRTFLTGELFALLRDRSTLTRAAAPSPDNEDDEPTGFAHGLMRAREGGHLLGALFSTRAMQLRSGRSHGWAVGFLSGLIIGREVAEAVAAFPATHEIALVGDPALAARYLPALAAHGLTATLHDGDACALAGLALPETHA